MSISSISGFSPVSPIGPGPTPPPQNTARPSGGPISNALSQALNQIGVNPSQGGTQSQSLTAFLQNLMSALHAQNAPNAQASAGNTGGDGDGDGGGGRRAHLGGNLQSLIQQLSSNSSGANASLSSLQQSFQDLLSASGNANSGASLTSFLQTFANNLSGPSGNLVNTQA